MKKILVIEDEIVLQRAYKDKLENAGFEAICVSGGDEGIVTAEIQKPDLIILDIILNDHLSGEDVLRHIKKNPKINTTPVIMMTNLDNKVLQFYDLGATWYFVKANTSLDQLVTKIKEILKI